MPGNEIRSILIRQETLEDGEAVPKEQNVC